MNHPTTIAAAMLALMFSLEARAAETYAEVSLAGRVIYPWWAPKVVDLKPDGVTTIMGYRAELHGHLTHQPMPDPKFYAKPGVYGFVDDLDRMVFSVKAPTADSYTVAAWVVFTATHGLHYWPGPSQTIDRLLPGRTCRRDLIGKLADALMRQETTSSRHSHNHSP